MKTCIDCGAEYDYDSSRPLGSSSERCASCRKKDSARNKKIILLNIAGNGTPQCRMCGYSNISGLTLIDGINYLIKPSTLQQKEKNARKQFIVCYNCAAKLQSNEMEFKVTNPNSYPIEVEFYSRHVRIVREKLIPKVNYGSEAIEAEVTRDEPTGDRVGRKKEILNIESAVDVSSVQEH